MKTQLRHFRPFLLTGAVVLLDQITKFIVVQTIPLDSLGASLLGGFLRIIHVRNLGIAFSIGESAPPLVRIVLIIIIPAIIVIGIMVFLVRSQELSTLQRWLLAGIAGGGIGNVFFDRIFRPLGVVDFIDVEFFDIAGLNRWPTFNVADMATIICVVILLANSFSNKNKPAGELAEEPVGEPAEESAEEPVGEPAGESVDSSLSDTSITAKEQDDGSE